MYAWCCREQRAYNFDLQNLIITGNPKSQWYKPPPCYMQLLSHLNIQSRRKRALSLKAEKLWVKWKLISAKVCRPIKLWAGREGNDIIMS